MYVLSRLCAIFIILTVCRINIAEGQRERFVSNRNLEALEEEGLMTYGYDCARTTTNFTTIALNEVGSCNVENQVISGKKTNVQIVQINDRVTSFGRRCKVVREQVFFRCSFFSDLQPIKGGYKRVTINIDQVTCDNMFSNSQYITPNGAKIVDLREGVETTHTLHETGVVSDGYCKGGIAYINGEQHDSAVSRDVYTIHYYYDELVFDYSKKSVVGLPETVKITKGSYFHPNTGNIYWHYQEYNICEGDRLTLLYNGDATHFILKGQREVIVINKTDTAFGIELDQQDELCGRVIRKLYNKKIIALVYTNESPVKIFPTKTEKVEDLDVSLNVDSRMIYLDRHYKLQMEKLGTYLAVRFCEIQKKILKRLIDMAYVLPERFVTELMNEEGYMVDIRGSIGYIHKCEKVNVVLRQTKSCYQEVPVRYQNQSYFLHPDSKILRPHGEELTCSIIAPTLYKLEGKWFRTYPMLEFVHATPVILNPNDNLTWKYEDSGSFNRRALYTREQLEDYRNSLYLRSSINSVTNNIGRGALGYSLEDSNIDISKMISQKGYMNMLNTLSKSILMGVWSLGNVFSNLFGLYIAYRLACMIFHWMANLYVIYRHHGFDYRLAGAFSNMFTRITTATGEHSVNVMKFLRKKRGKKESDVDTQENDGDSLKGNEKEVVIETPIAPPRNTNNIYPTFNVSHSNTRNPYA
uniref:Glycoprotein n=1 Tax=Diaporthe gulyae chuvirus 1 TaxID=3077421 RepID=A0AA96HAC9_9VIRU|nr:MAG: glycoprotein [Diaporthe gulyae chuvirus 1]